MDKIEIFLQKLSDTIEWFVGQVSMLLFGSMTVVVLVGVLFRYGFQIPLSWTEELSRYLMIWGASLAVSTGIKYDEHVGLTVLYDLLHSDFLRLLLNTIVSLLVLGFLVIMSYYSLQMAVEAKHQIAQSLGISMLLPALAVPVAMGIAMLQLILNFFLKPELSDFT